MTMLSSTDGPDRGEPGPDHSSGTGMTGLALQRQSCRSPKGGRAVIDTHIDTASSHACPGPRGVSWRWDLCSPPHWAPGWCVWLREPMGPAGGAPGAATQLLSSDWQ